MSFSLLSRSLLAVLIYITSAVSLLAEDAAREKQLEFFESKIRPVLIENCYECHNSLDAAEGEFAVDHRQALLDGGASGVMLVPGKPNESPLLAILRHEVEGMEMPQGGPKLDDAVINDFRSWIAAGAIDPRDEPPSAEEAAKATSWEETRRRRMQWWSFQPIGSPKPPTTSDPLWNTNPIDRFVHRQHNEHDLKPADLATPAVLVRRLYITLIGLPPTAEQARHWVDLLQHTSPQERDAVYAQLVDELLKSPHFGERWARHWMDWTRYAESHGSEGDPEIVNAWAYRDYLIRAINADVPVDQLIREHVAGDLLEKPRVNETLGINESAIGPAHWRMVFHGFLPTDALDERVRFTDDQINCFSKAFLGLTVSCARCHDHKFDAISQADYYALYGVLSSCRPAQTTIDLPERIAPKRKELQGLKQEIRRALAQDWLESLERFEETFSSLKTNTKVGDPNESPWAALVVARDEASFEDSWGNVLKSWKQSLAPHPGDQTDEYDTAWNLADNGDFQQWFSQGSGLPDTPNAAGTFSIEIEGDRALRGIYPAGVYSHDISSKLPARLASPDLTLKSNGEVWVQVIGDGAASFRYVVQNYPRSGGIYPVRRLTPNWQWIRLDAEYWSGDSIHLELTTAQDAALPSRKSSRSWFGVRKAIVRYPGEPEPKDVPAWLPALMPLVEASPPKSSNDLRAIFAEAIHSSIDAWATEQMTDSQAALLQACLEKGVLANRIDQLPQAGPLVQRYRELEAKIPVPRRVPGVAESRGSDQPIYVRGDPKHPGERVPRRFLEAIDTTPYASEQSGRLELADDLLREDNPFTRRVMVNRVWHHLLGQGIVRTPDNLGKMGDQPSDPQLLDWLARHFADEGWSLQQLVREIVTTRTWQLASTASPDQLEKDPENRFLARANVRRMEAEAIRDALLAVSGQLDETTYGPPAKESDPRRSIYLPVIRNDLNPLLRVFDFPEPFSTVGRRDVTNVPAQSLTMLNDPEVEAYADAWATRVANAPELASDESRIQSMFQAAFGRAANQEEIAECQAYVASIIRRISIAQEVEERTRRELDSLLAKRATIRDPIHERLQQERATARQLKPEGLPQPIAHWDFSQSTNDLVGTAHGTLEGDARIEEGALLLSGNGYLVTSPLTQSLKAKTLEAWVQLDTLEQKAGGVMSVQRPDGSVFDAIVFGEQQAGHWLAGSNSFQRTQPFLGSVEQDAVRGPIHLAIVYHADGRITGYRNGIPYGKSYTSGGAMNYAANDTVVTLGLRHLPGIGNRFLTGKVYQARLYDQALTAEQITDTSQMGPMGVTEQDVLAAMPEFIRSQDDVVTQQIIDLQRQQTKLSTDIDSQDELLPWKELARALVTFKEFIYVR